MGVVYEAEHESLKSRVALKVMHPRFRADGKYLKRFHVEARSAAGLHHTNIVSVFDYGEQDGVCYYAMQFIPGQPLDDVLADLRRLRSEGSATAGSGVRRPPGADAATGARPVAEGLVTGQFVPSASPGLATDPTEPFDPGPDGDPPGEDGPAEGPRRSFGLSSGSLGGAEGRYYREVARIGAQVADALDYAHRRGVLHRDIKPPNLLLDALGNVWVTDFGLAKLEAVEEVSQSQELVGTLRYMPPERFRGASDRRGDTYALGATLYELLTLQPAFDGADQLRLIDRIVHERPTPPRQVDGRVPRDLETIVLRALAKDPKDRFGSAREMAEELRRFLAGHPIRSRPVSVPERFWRWCKRDPWLAGASVAAAALTVVLVVGMTTAAYVFRDQVSALKRERNRTVEASRDARRRAVDAYIAQADAGRYSRRPGQRFSSLKAIGDAGRLLASWASEGTEEARHDVATRRDVLRDLAIAALALPDIRAGGSMGPAPPGSTGVFVADPSYSRHLALEHGGNCTLYRSADRVELARFPNLGEPGPCWPLFGPDGRTLAIGYRDGRLRLWRVDGDRPELVADEPGARRRPGPCASGATGPRSSTRRSAARSGSRTCDRGGSGPCPGARGRSTSRPSTPTAGAWWRSSRTPADGPPGSGGWTTRPPPRRSTCRPRSATSPGRPTAAAWRWRATTPGSPSGSPGAPGRRRWSSPA